LVKLNFIKQACWVIEVDWAIDYGWIVTDSGVFINLKGGGPRGTFSKVFKYYHNFFTLDISTIFSPPKVAP